MCEIYSNLTIKIPERRRRRSGVFIVNFEHILHIVLVFPFFDFAQVNTGWAVSQMHMLSPHGKTESDSKYITKN